jgi:ABC-2 type transport system permease protein
MNRSWSASLAQATRYEISQHGRNRIALGLVVMFIPAWLTLVHLIISGIRIGFYDHVHNRMFMVDGNQLSMISGAMNAITLIVGFMMFSAVRRSREFDRRLVLAGYSRSAMLLAKLLALVLSAVVVALYAELVLTAFWRPLQMLPFLLGLVLAGLTYGGLGIVLGLVFRSDLTGMFLIIMISLVDVMVQNPIISPSAQTKRIGFLPTYGSMQNVVAAAFTRDLSVGYFALGLCWLAVAALIGMIAFYSRTRDHVQHDDIAVPVLPKLHKQEQEASVIVGIGSGGTLVVRSSSGPVLLCTCASEHQSVERALREPFESNASVPEPLREPAGDALVGRTVSRTE